MDIVRTRGKLMHPLELKLGVNSEVILNAIHNSSDLTQRGLRGIIAEHQLKNLVLDKLPAPWFIMPVTDTGVDFALCDGHGGHYVTLQCKMQTQRAGSPRCDKWGRPMVETQKTRMRGIGKSKTRLYCYNDFDILAVSLWPSTGDWERFIYAAATDLTPARRRPGSLAAWQTITTAPIWHTSLPKVLAKVQGRQAIVQTRAELAGFGGE